MTPDCLESIFTRNYKYFRFDSHLSKLYPIRKSPLLEIKILREGEEKINGAQDERNHEFVRVISIGRQQRCRIESVAYVALVVYLPISVGRAPLWTSRYFISCGFAAERASRKEERRESEGDRRKLEWFSNRFPFQVRAPASTRRQGLSNSQPASHLAYRFANYPFKCLRTGYELAPRQRLYLYTFHCAVSTEQDRQLYSIGSSYLTDQSFLLPFLSFFFFFKKEFFYTSLFLIFKYFPKVKTYLDTSYLTTL